MQMCLRFLDPRFRGRYAHLIVVFRYGPSRDADALVLKLAENHLVRERGMRIFVLDDGGYPMLDAPGREVFLPCRPLYLSMKKSTLGTAADILDCAWCRSFRAVLEGSGAGGLETRSKLSTAAPTVHFCLTKHTIHGSGAPTRTPMAFSGTSFRGAEVSTMSATARCRRYAIHSTGDHASVSSGSAPGRSTAASRCTCSEDSP